MKVWLELAAEGTADEKELAEARKTAQQVADKLGVTVQLMNGNYGAHVIEPKRGSNK